MREPERATKGTGVAIDGSGNGDDGRRVVSARGFVRGFGYETLRMVRTPGNRTSGVIGAGARYQLSAISH